METRSLEANYEVRQPRLLTAAAVLWVNMYGFVLGVFVAGAVAWVSFRPLGISTYVIPLTAVALATFCLPIGFGNSFARRLASRIERPPGANVHLVQLATSPRLRTGLRAALEDADDIGWLAIDGERLLFRGDSVSLDLPLTSIQKASLHNVGFRGFFIYGPRLRITTAALKGVLAVEFADRASLFLPQSRHALKEVYQKLQQKR